MSTKATEKIIEALQSLMEGYAELQEALEEEYNPESVKDEDEDDETLELSAEVDSAIVTEVRSALEGIMESEDYAAEEIASVISTLTDALEEIDPNVFNANEEEEDEAPEDLDDEDLEDLDDDELDDDE